MPRGSTQQASDIGKHRNLVEIRMLRCYKLNFDVVPMCSAHWVDSSL